MKRSRSSAAAMHVPNRLGAKRISRLHDPAMTALIAFRMGRGTSDHYHSLLAQLMIAENITEIVARHRHLTENIHDALAALNAVFERQAQRTIQDGFWSATVDEMEKIELGCQIARALSETTPGPVVRRAMVRLSQRLDATIDHARRGEENK